MYAIVGCVGGADSIKVKEQIIYMDSDSLLVGLQPNTVNTQILARYFVLYSVYPVLDITERERDELMVSPVRSLVIRLNKTRTRQVIFVTDIMWQLLVPPEW